MSPLVFYSSIVFYLIGLRRSHWRDGRLLVGLQDLSEKLIKEVTALPADDQSC